ncbi:hypothetical protein D9M68_798010 [compost metagenome]
MAQAHTRQRTMIVILVAGIAVPYYTVGTGLYIGDAVIIIVSIALVVLVGKATVITQQVYLTADQVIVIVYAFEALVGGAP